MLILYNIALTFYSLAIHLASFFNDKAKKLHNGRNEAWGKLEAYSQVNKSKTIWFHAASLGEFEQGRPIIERLKKEINDISIVVTFFSPSGYEVKKNYQEADLILYLPSDSSSNAKRFLELLQPTTAIFIKYEFWYHYLHECKKRNVNTLSVSSIFRNEQPFFKAYGSLHRKMLTFFDHIFVQDDDSKELLSKINIEHVSVSGDTRFDRVKSIPILRMKIDIVEKFKGTEKIFVLGSTWPHDIEVLVPLINKYSSDIKFVIAPHNVNEGELKDIEQSIDVDSVRYSAAEDKELSEYRVLIIDNIGMLSSIYGYGEFAYVGGAFRGALHNTLEAATHGVPVFYGDHPSNAKFKEAIELAKIGAGIPVQNASDLLEKLGSMLEIEELRIEKGRLASEFVINNSGATDIIVEYLTSRIES